MIIILYSHVYTKVRIMSFFKHPTQLVKVIFEQISIITMYKPAYFCEIASIVTNVQPCAKDILLLTV